MYRNSVVIRPLQRNNLTATTFEFQLAVVTSAKKSCIVANIYRPPHLSSSVFLEELSDLIANIYVDTIGNLLLCGDMNCPGSGSDRVNDDLSILLSSFKLIELVHKSTRCKNLLDVVATDDPAAVLDLKVYDCGLISDYCLVVFEMKFHTHRGQPIKYSYRNLKNLDIDALALKNLDVDALADALRRSLLFTSPEPTVNSYTDQLVDVVSRELDRLAPLRTVTRRQSKLATMWLSDEAVKAKRVRRRYENILKIQQR